jgi:hypothetical protein
MWMPKRITKSTKDTKNGFGSSCSISNRWSTKARACTDMCLDCDYRVDLLVEDRLIIAGGVVNRTGYYTPQA